LFNELSGFSTGALGKKEICKVTMLFTQRSLKKRLPIPRTRPQEGDATYVTVLKGRKNVAYSFGTTGNKNGLKIDNGIQTIVLLCFSSSFCDFFFFSKFL